MSFAERQITITITLQARQGAPTKGVAANQTPTFEGTNSNTVKLTGGGPASQNGLRIAAKVTRAGAPGYGEASVQIYNLPLSLINQIGTLGLPYIFMVGKNTITIEAGDAGETPKKIFSGTINSAYADFSGMPDVVFNISAQSFAFLSAAPAQAVGYKGSVSVATIFANLAAQAGLTFINNFPNSDAPLLSNPYLSGSVGTQIRMLAKHSGVSWTIDDVNNTLIIWPRNSGINGTGGIPLIAPPPDGNMVGFPAYTQQGIKVKTEFTAAIGYGALVQVKSSLTNANGKWFVYYQDYDLECQNANGPWFTNLELAAPGFPVFPQSSAP